jgi:hypothetical protein
MTNIFGAGHLDLDIHILVSKCDKKTLTIWALDCADRALHLYENIIPGDGRPGAAIKVGRSWVRNEIGAAETIGPISSAHEAAAEATDEAAGSAARAAGQALNTVHDPEHSKDAAAHAAKAVGSSGGNQEAERVAVQTPDPPERYERNVVQKGPITSNVQCITVSAHRPTHTYDESGTSVFFYIYMHMVK